MPVFVLRLGGALGDDNLGLEMNRTLLRRARPDTGTLSTEQPKPQARLEGRETARLDPRLAKAPVDRRVRMRRCELLPRPDPLAGVGAKVWTWRAGRSSAQ